VTFRLGAALTVFAFAFHAQGAEERAKAAGALDKLRDPAQSKRASSASSVATRTAAPVLPSFVIPRDTCQQGEPLQTLPLTKP
jgi:hypothetical protein